MNIWFVSTFGLLWIILLWTFMCKFFCVDMFFSVLSIYLGVELLDHMVTVIFWRIVKLFFKVVGLFYIPTSSEWGFQFLYICTILAFIHLRLILVDVKCILFFVCISQMVNDVKDLFMYLLTFCIYSFLDYLFMFFCPFSIDLFDFVFLMASFKIFDKIKHIFYF